MNVLSLFDGMSCGQIALERAGVKVDNYFASEIDKYAIQVTQKNYPNTKQIGSVTEVKGKDLPKIDLLIGGSPCQGFSFAGKQLNFDDPRSKLFFEFVRLMKECKPRYFLLENVKMKKEYQDVITDILGVKPIEINSALVSAQTRKRLYWTNIPNVGQPKDKNIMLMNIHLSNITSEELLKSSVKKNDLIIWNDPDPQEGCDYTVRKIWDINEDTAMIHYGNADFCSEAEVYLSELSIINKKNINLKQYNGERFLNPRNFGGKGYVGTNSKSVSLTLPSGNNATLVKTKFGNWRSLTACECEQLQNVPKDYTSGVTNGQRLSMLGNGWTVDVIAHIFKYMDIG
jgi:DNA (cytosine-5)-methyltransferase 3A